MQSEDKAIKLTLDSLGKKIDSLLGPLGFQRAENSQWRREKVWMIEEIDLGIKGGIRVTILPSFRIILARKAETLLDKKWEYVAHASVPRIVRPNDGPDFDITVPRFRLFASRFEKAVLTDIKTGLPWFDSFSTPQLFMENLHKFLKVGCPAYLDALAFLKQLERTDIQR